MRGHEPTGITQIAAAAVDIAATIEGDARRRNHVNFSDLKADDAPRATDWTNSPIALPLTAAAPSLGPAFVTARFTDTFTPGISGGYRFVSNADDYVGLWVNGVEEIAWSGHTANDRFSTHAFQLVKDVPMHLRIDYRQDKLGYKLTLRLARQPDGEQRDLDDSVGRVTPSTTTEGAGNK